MKCAKIISSSIIKNFWCKTCKSASNVLYKTNEGSYCEKCVTKEVADNSIPITQNRERFNQK